MSATLTTTSRDIPGGPMSSGEIQFCQQIRAATRAALDGRVPFFVAVTRVRVDLNKLSKSGFDLDAAVAGGFQASVADPVPSPGNVTRPIPLSPAERDFLNDLDGFLDFALRNGLSFTSVLTVLAHDFAEIAAHELSVDKAIADGFRPKVDGWAKRNAEPVGEVEEPLGP
jgi:hypothetical protein